MRKMQFNLDQRAPLHVIYDMQKLVYTFAIKRGRCNEARFRPISGIVPEAGCEAEI